MHSILAAGMSCKRCNVIHPALAVSLPGNRHSYRDQEPPLGFIPTGGTEQVAGSLPSTGGAQPIESQKAHWKSSGRASCVLGGVSRMR